MQILRSYKDILTRNIKDKKDQFGRLGEISATIGSFAYGRNISVEEIRIQNAEAIIHLREEKERRAREEAEREEEHLSELELAEESVEDELEELYEAPDEILEIFTASDADEESVEEEEEESPEEEPELETEEPLAAVKKRKPKKKIWFDKTYCADEDDSFCYRQPRALDIAAAYSGDSSPPEISSYENLLLSRYCKKKPHAIKMEKKPKVPEKKVFPCSLKKIESVYPEIVIEENQVTIKGNETVNVRTEPVPSISVKQVVPTTTVIRTEASYKKKTPVVKEVPAHRLHPSQVTKRASDLQSATSYLHQSLGAVPYSLDPYPDYPPGPSGRAIQIQTFPSRYGQFPFLESAPSAKEESPLAAVLEGPKYSNPLLRESPSVQKLRYKYFFEYYIPTPTPTPGSTPVQNQATDTNLNERMRTLSQTWNLSEDPSDIKLSSSSVKGDPKK